jgi:hypothetical protein
MKAGGMVTLLRDHVPASAIGPPLQHGHAKA